MKGSDFAELTAFVAVAETQSFVRAASGLGLSRSALSDTIRALEERVGTRLLNRTTRSVSLTDAGRTLFARLPAAFAEIKDAVDGLSIYRERPAGTVRLNLPRVGVEVRADNVAALRIAERLGYVEYARGHEVYYRDGAYVDEIQLFMGKDAWNERWGATEREYAPLASDATR